MIVIRGAARLSIDPSESLLAYLPPSVPELRTPLLRADRLCGLSLLSVARLWAELPSLRTEVSGDDVAVVLGTAHGCHKTDEEYYLSFLQGQPSPRLFAYTLPSSPGGELSIFYRLRGPGLALCSGRASGILALSEAVSLLSTGQAAACLVLAVDVAGAALSLGPRSDAAVALWLTLDSADSGGSSPLIAATAEAFFAGEPKRAVARSLADLPVATVLADRETALLAASALGDAAVVADAPDGAVAGLWCLLDGLGGEMGRFSVVAVDPSGQAAALSVIASAAAGPRL